MEIEARLIPEMNSETQETYVAMEIVDKTILLGYFKKYARLFAPVAV